MIKLEKDPNALQRGEQLYEGKAKKVYATNDPNLVIVSYKDDATAFNGEKKGTIVGKGVVNNRMSNFLMGLLEAQGIPTHYAAELNERETLVEKVDIIKAEVIVRNVSAGSFAKRYGVPEGIAFEQPTFELSLKDDALGDPLMTNTHAIALGVCTAGELAQIYEYTMKINTVMKEFFEKLGITLVDFKIEFGKNAKDEIILADEISPDTCRFWEAGTWDTTKHTSFDKDRFRRDLGDVEAGYQEMMKRLGLEA